MGLVDIIAETIYVFLVTVVMAGILMFFGILFVVFSGSGMHMDFTLVKTTAVILFIVLIGALFLYILVNIYEMLREKK